MNAKEQFGKLLESLRKDYKLTQQEVAKSLGLTRGYISAVENGRNILHEKQLNIIAKKFCIEKTKIDKLKWFILEDKFGDLDFIENTKHYKLYPEIENLQTLIENLSNGAKDLALQWITELCDRIKKLKEL